MPARRSTRNGITSKQKQYAPRRCPTAGSSLYRSLTPSRFRRWIPFILNGFANGKPRDPQRKQGKTKRERAEAIVRQQELITKWRPGQYSVSLYDVPVMLRIDGDEMVTSRGARFPVSHAKRALAFVRKIRESQKAYVRDGHTIHLDAYALDRIEANGTVKARCHVVSWEEIERIAPALDSFPASATAIDPTLEVQS